MSFMYFILAVTGWVWTVVFGTYLVIRLTRKQSRGFEVSQLPQHHEKQL